MTRVAVCDPGTGNLHSVVKALRHVGAEPVRAEEPADLAGATRLVLPGVGAFGRAADRLRERGLDEALRERVEAGTPLLGICLGHQLLFEASAEKGSHEGLGLVPGRVRRLAGEVRVPHVGWNRAVARRPDHPLLAGQEEEPWFYFVHSYVACDVAARDVVCETEYGPARFPSVVCRGSACGVQFHPEKSQRAGLGLLESFCSWTPGSGPGKDGRP